jgi:hypothetical protein
MRRLGALLRSLCRRVPDLAALRPERRQRAVDRRRHGWPALRRPHARGHARAARLAPAAGELDELRRDMRATRGPAEISRPLFSPPRNCASPARSCAARGTLAFRPAAWRPRLRAVTYPSAAEQTRVGPCGGAPEGRASYRVVADDGRRKPTFDRTPRGTCVSSSTLRRPDRGTTTDRGTVTVPSGPATSSATWWGWG